MQKYCKVVSLFIKDTRGFVGNLHMWSLSQVFEHTRTICKLHENFLRVNDKFIFRDPQNTFFLMQVRYELSDEQYRATNRSKLALEIKLSEQLVGISKSALQLLTTIERKEDGKELANLFYKYCRVNREQRKSQPIPEWFLQYIRHIIY